MATIWLQNRRKRTKTWIGNRLWHSPRDNVVTFVLNSQQLAIGIRLHRQIQFLVTGNRHWDFLYIQMLYVSQIKFLPMSGKVLRLLSQVVKYSNIDTKPLLLRFVFFFQKVLSSCPFYPLLGIIKFSVIKKSYVFKLSILLAKKSQK